MSYNTQADLADDGFLRRRTIACAASEGIGDPEVWASMNRWALSVSPGWDAAYSTALADEVDRPGESEAVISDAMILTAVKTIRAEEPE